MEFYPKVVLERYCKQLAYKGKQNKSENKPHTLPFRHFFNIIMNIACVAGVRKGRGRELGLSRSRARPNFSLPPPLSTPATQAIMNKIIKTNYCVQRKTYVRLRNTII